MMMDDAEKTGWESMRKDRNRILKYVAIGLCAAFLIYLFIYMGSARAACISSSSTSAINQTITVGNDTYVIDMSPILQDVSALCNRIAYLENLTYNQSLLINSTNAYVQSMNLSNYTGVVSYLNSSMLNLTDRMSAMNSSLISADSAHSSGIDSLSSKLDSKVSSMNDTINGLMESDDELPDYMIYVIVAVVGIVAIFGALIFLRQPKEEIEPQ
jgi:hypothetical protein